MNSEFVHYGPFDPLEARRLATRLEREHVRFRVAGTGNAGIGYGGTQVRRHDEVEISVHPEDDGRARRILLSGLEPTPDS